MRFSMRYAAISPRAVYAICAARWSCHVGAARCRARRVTPMPQR
jgi:hypothetical protein